MNPEDDNKLPPSNLETEITTVEDLILSTETGLAANDNATEFTPTTKAFINASDLGPVIDILVKVDNITAEEAIRRLNKMSQKNLLVIVPNFGRSSK